MATVVITGAAGFLGRFITSQFASSGFIVVPLSRRPLPGFLQVDDYCRSPSGDILIHLAEEPNRSTVNNLGESYVRNVTGVVRSLSKRSYQRIIYASSGAVYGDQNEIPCRVQMPVVANDSYSQSKLTNEKVILDSGGAIVRLSNIYGDGMSANNVVSDIVRQIPGAGPLYVRDDKPVCDFLHVTDAASAFRLMVESSYCGIANVGSGIGTSVKALAELLLVLAAEEHRQIIATGPSARRSMNVLDISETTKILGWSPSSHLKEQMLPLLHSREKVVS